MASQSSTSSIYYTYSIYQILYTAKKYTLGVAILKPILIDNWNEIRVRRSEVVDEEQSILSCCNHNYGYILNGDWMAVTTLANHMCNFRCERHVHLRS